MQPEGLDNKKIPMTDFSIVPQPTAPSCKTYLVRFKKVGLGLLVVKESCKSCREENHKSYYNPSHGLKSVYTALCPK